MALPLTGIGHFVDFIVLAFFYYRLRKSKVANNKFFFYFERFTLSMGIFFLLMAIPNLILTGNSFMLGLGYVIGHIFLYISYAYLIRVSLLILKPSFDSTKIFTSYLLLALIITLTNIYYFNYPVILKDGITAFNVNPLVGILIIFISMMTLLPSAVLFIREAFMQPQQRTRFALIGVSFILIIIGGPMHDVATAPATYMLADVVTTIGFITMFFGVIFGSKSTLKIKSKKI